MRKDSEYNTYKFFRRCFRIPERQSLRWCIIEEITGEKTEWRLGILLVGSDLYLDVACRRFFSQIETRAVTRRCYPAERIPHRDHYAYRAPGAAVLRKPKSYVRDIYYPALFDRELLDDRLQ